MERAAGAAGAVDAKKPLALLVLADDELRSHTLLRLLSDPGIGDAAEKVVAPGAIVRLDVASDPPRLIKVLRAAAPATLRKELLAAK